MAACTAMALWRDGSTLMLRGTVSPAAAASPAAAVLAGPLLTKAVARKNGAPDYLPALQLLPGRVEFSYMPENSQGILMPSQLVVRAGHVVHDCENIVVVFRRS